MMTFLASSIPLLTIQVDYVVQYTKSNIPKMPAHAYVAGYIILLTIQYMWVLVIGSDSQTTLGRLGHIVADEVNVHHIEPEFYSEKIMQSSSLPSSAVLGGPNSRIPSKYTIIVEGKIHTTHIEVIDPTSQSTTSVHTIAAQKTSGPVEYNEKVQALHSCK
jgi:hypothetical protein